MTCLEAELGKLLKKREKEEEEKERREKDEEKREEERRKEEIRREGDGRRREDGNMVPEKEYRAVVQVHFFQLSSLNLLFYSSSFFSSFSLTSFHYTLNCV